MEYTRLSNPPDDYWIQPTRRWIERVVVDLNLCPFARRELERDSIRYCVSQALTERELLEHLAEELAFLERHPDVETTVLIHPHALQDFLCFNDFLDLVDRYIATAGYDGVFQVASFHPQYQFADAPPESAENYSNRSPFPMLHLLREESVSRAVDGHPDIEQVPLTNIDSLRAIGTDALESTLRSCADP